MTCVRIDCNVCEDGYVSEDCVVSEDCDVCEDGDVRTVTCLSTGT